MAGAAPFVDWLSISQHHSGCDAEFVGSLKFTMDESGQVVAESAGRRTYEGSYGSALQICVHAGWVRVSGNPARWGKPDNLVGFDLDESMHRINYVLKLLDLPPFTRGLRMPARDRDELDTPRWTGAAFARIDLTANYETGDETLAKLLIKEYSGRAGAYLRKAVYGDETAMFHNSRRTIKAYRKGPDMAIHAKESPWTKWVEGRGIVRHELALKSRLLSDTGLRYWGNCTMGKLEKLFKHETELLQLREVRDDLDAVLAQLPKPTRLIHAAWLRGVDVRAIASRSAFYRHRKLLRESIGVDIAEQTAQVIAIKRRIELRPLQVPEAYWTREAA